MVSNRKLRKVVAWIEWMVLSIAMICFASYLMVSILDGMGQFLAAMGDHLPIDRPSTISGAGITIDKTRASGTSIEYAPNGGTFGTFRLALWILYLLVSKISLFFTILYQLTWMVMDNLRNATFVTMIRSLYLGGPNLKGFGFWKGKRLQDICAQLNGSDADFWGKNLEECKKAIDVEVQSLVIGAQMIIIVILAIKYLTHLWATIRIRSNTPPPSPIKNLIRQ